MFASKIASVLKTKVPNLSKNPSAIEAKRFINNCKELYPKKWKVEEQLKKEEEFKSMWENPKCDDTEPCEVFRHDIKLLKPSNRTYMRTWNECQPVVKQVILCSGPYLPAEVEIRPRRKREQQEETHNCAPCEGDEFKLDLMRCIQPPKLDNACAKVKLPGCRAVGPLRCTKIRVRPCCQKRCVQYPAYSECCRDKPKVPKPDECKCYSVYSTCEIFDMYRKFPKK